MKKYFLFTLMMRAFILQAEPVQDLGKYSYFCFAVDKNKSLNGTCFFYKYNNDIYLVSNYHVFYAADIMTNKQLLHVDTLRVGYTSTQNGRQKFYKVTNDKDEIRFFKHYDSPDLMAKKLINIPADMPVNLINDLIEPSYFDEQPDSVILFGYPTLYAKVKSTDEIKVQKCFLTGTFQGVPIKFAEPDLKDPHADSHPRKIQRKIENTEFEINTCCLPGFSGSPVYGRFHKNGTVYYKFIGVLFASNMINNFSVAIKGKVFYDFIKNISAPKVLAQLE